MGWPNNADGDVFRRLETNGFDFSKSYAVDFTVDFEKWPPAKAALDLLTSKYGDLDLYEPDEEGDGYVLFQVVSPVTYEGIMSVQRNASIAMKPFGGICESWGVAH